MLAMNKTVDEIRREAFDAFAMNNMAAAIEAFEKYLAQKSDDALACSTLGNALKREGRFGEAVCRHQEALRLQPDSAELHSNIGATYLAWGQWSAAIRSFQTAISLEPSRLEFVFNLGTALHTTGDFVQACQKFKEVVETDPSHFRSWTNLGSSLKALGLFEESVQALVEAVASAPQFAEAQWNLALGRLTLGQYSEGWERYEWRRKIADIPIKQFDAPDWDGQSLDGTLLVHAEQGHGDTFQFSRFLMAAQQKVKNLVFLCPPHLKPILQGLKGAPQIITDPKNLPPFDFHIPLMSLPYRLGIKDELGMETPYLTADSERRIYWKEKLEALPGGKVGMVWQGNPNYKDDGRRSFPLCSLVPLSTLDNLQFISLQKEHGLEQLDALSSSWPIVDWNEELDSEHGAFVDSAAILAEVPVLITSDTSTAHLAGALGTEVWLLLPDVADWRWGLEESTLWYPTMRLFRQNEPGNQRKVFWRRSGLT